MLVVRHLKDTNHLILENAVLVFHPSMWEHAKRPFVCSFGKLMMYTFYIYLVWQSKICPRRTGSWLQMNRLKSRKNQLKLETLGGLRIVLEESIERASNERKQNRKMTTCNRLDLELLGSWPTLYAQKLPLHWFTILRVRALSPVVNWIKNKIKNKHICRVVQFNLESPHPFVEQMNSIPKTSSV